MSSNERDPFEVVAEGWHYTREHFKTDPTQFVGDIPCPAWDEAMDALLEEVRMLRTVLVFADGAILSFNRQYGSYDFVLADLYNETTPLQGVIRRAGCHERGKFLTGRDDGHSLTIMHGHDMCSCGWEGEDGQQHMADVIAGMASHG